MTYLDICQTVTQVSLLAWRREAIIKYFDLMPYPLHNWASVFATREKEVVSVDFVPG